MFINLDEFKLNYNLSNEIIVPKRHIKPFIAMV
jgi:hypothetical protein